MYRRLLLHPFRFIIYYHPAIQGHILRAAEASLDKPQPKSLQNEFLQGWRNSGARTPRLATTDLSVRCCTTF